MGNFEVSLIGEVLPSENQNKSKIKMQVKTAGTVGNQLKGVGAYLRDMSKTLNVPIEKILTELIILTQSRTNKEIHDDFQQDIEKLLNTFKKEKKQ